MGFWDWFKKRETTAFPLKAERSPDGGKLRDGKKHGRWVEREEREDTRWDDAKREFIKLGTYGWRELTYVDGVKHGPFAWRYANGVALRLGTYVEDKIDGRLLIHFAEGPVAGEGGFRAGKMHGHWVQRYRNGNLNYESDYVDDKRHGAWQAFFESGAPKEAGAHEHGERTGAWKVWSVDGVLIEAGTYVAGKRHGAWQLRRADGSIAAHGEYLAGAMHGPWRSLSLDGKIGPPRVCADENDLPRWAELETAIALMTAYEPTSAWIEKTKAAFAIFAEPWQVTAKTDELGQRSLSAPLGAMWQLRVAVGVPVHVCCHDEVWSRIVGAIDKLPASARNEAVGLVEHAGLRYPGYMPRDWLTAILEEEADDPRARIATGTEPGREFDTLRSQRLQRRVPHLVQMSLRECAFPVGLGALFEHGYPSLERLWLVRNETEPGAIGELFQILARAAWVTKLRGLAVIDGDDAPTDAQLAALLANPHLRALQTLTLSDVTLGAATARALREGEAQKSLEYVELRRAKLTVDALTALIACPRLAELELRDCELPKKLTAAQAAAIDTTALRIVKLAGTLPVDRYSNGKDACTPQSFARRLALMPALGKLDALDLSDNALDGNAAAELAKSPYIKSVKRLVWTGNDEDDKPLAALRAALGGELVTTRAPSASNVVVVKL